MLCVMMPMAEISIREMRKEDIPDIIEALKTARLDFPWGFLYNVYRIDESEVWFSFCGYSGYRTLVAEYDGRVVALLEYFPHWEEENNLYIQLILTHRDFRGLGIGTRLIKHCLGIAIEKKFDLLSLHTWATNRAVRLYRRTGFCWMPSTYVYMKNFVPRLFKYDELQKIFRVPENLIDCLVEPPREEFLNGHRAWRYRWKIDNDYVEALFDSNTGLLLGLKWNDEYVLLEPPEDVEYVSSSNTSVSIRTSRHIPAYIGDKVYYLRPGENKLSLEAKKDNKFLLEQFEFGYRLKVLDNIGIEVEPRLLVSPCAFKILLFNNSDSSISGDLVVVPGDGLKVYVSEECIELPPKSFKEVSAYALGEGKCRIYFKEAKKDVVVFKKDYVNRDKCRITSRYWVLDTKEEMVKCNEVSNFTMWWMSILDNERLRFDSPVGDGFVSRTESATIRLIPEFRGDELFLEFEIMASRDIDDYLMIQFWLSMDKPYEDLFFIVPVGDYFVRERYVYPFFPMDYEFVREELMHRVFGCDIGDKRILIEFEPDGFFTMRNPYSIRIYYKVRLKAGEKVRKRLCFRLGYQDKEIHGKPIKRALETYIIGDCLYVKNNWHRPLDANIRYNGEDVKVRLNPKEEKKVVSNLRGFGVLSIDVGLLGFLERRKIPYFVPVRVDWDDKYAEYGDICVRLDGRGGSIKSLVINGEEILKWSDSMFYTSHHIAKTYGGCSLLISVDGEDKEIYLKDWDYVGDGKFRVDIGDIEVCRKICFLDKTTIMEEIKVKNNGYRPRKVSAVHMMFLSKHIINAKARGLTSSGDDLLFLSSLDHGLVAIGNVRIGVLLMASEKQGVSINQQIGEEGSIASLWDWTIKLNEEKTARIVITTNVENIEKFLEKDINFRHYGIS